MKMAENVQFLKQSVFCNKKSGYYCYLVEESDLYTKIMCWYLHLT